MYSIDVIKAMVTPIAEYYGIKTVWLFGSYARGEQTEQSDMDFHIDRGDVCSGLVLGAFFADLEEAFTTKIDVVTTQSLSKEFLEQIKEEEILLYAKKEL